jgi:hypothetical protein|tara:strand:+ start:9397 stop:9633 length:237 start_codon:yes stop_codon:yes gene_type:complete
MHPYVKDADTLTEDQIEEKIFKLNRIYYQTSNQDVQNQIVLALDTYKVALEEKRIEAKKIQENRENGENGLDNLIKVS